MTGIWPVAGLAGLLLLGFAALFVAGVAVIHVGYRWWLMIFCGMDWDDAGTLIHARARRRHGAHESGRPASWPQAGWQDVGATTDGPGPAYGPGMTDRLGHVVAASTRLGELPRVKAEGRPPWEDHTQEIPATGNPWLAEGGGLDQTIKIRLPGARRD
jgi:hypothetical protein